MKKIIIFCLILMFTCSGKSQKLNNNFEFGILGNLGFLHAGYTISAFNFNDVAINLGGKICWVPGSGDEESSNQQNNPSVPNFIHLNAPLEFLWKFHRSNSVGIGLSYSKILVISDEYHTRSKSNYNRILGEISYGHILNWNKDSDRTTWIKIYFSPMISDDHANDVDNIPVRLSFIYNF